MCNAMSARPDLPQMTTWTDIIDLSACIAVNARFSQTYNPLLTSGYLQSLSKMPISPNQNVVPIPDDILTSKAMGTFELLLFLQAEYGGLPLPLTHRAVVQVLDLVRAIAVEDEHLLLQAEEWQRTVLGLHDTQQGALLASAKSPAVNAPPTRRPLHFQHSTTAELPFRHPRVHSHSLPSYDTATSPSAVCHMKPVTVAPEVDTDLKHKHPATNLDQVTNPVAPEMDEEHYHSLPDSPLGLFTTGEPQEGSTQTKATPPLRLPSPVSTCEVSVNVQTTSTLSQSSPLVSVQTMLELPASPLLTPTRDFSTLPVPAMAPNTPTSAPSEHDLSLLRDVRVDSLVAA